MSTYRDEIAQIIIDRIEAGTAPWQKPWKAGAYGHRPYNPVSGKPYHGINDLYLSMQGRDDPRWMTYKQAQGLGAQVRKGEKSTTIEYWQWSKQVALKDEQGNPVRDENGEQKYQTLQLDRPNVFYAKVFNGEQIDGLAPLFPHEKPGFEPVQLADEIIKGAGVTFIHDQLNRNFYRPSSDKIHMTAQASFRTVEGYYATALHELGHATGHPNRLNREFGPHGSEIYAREELRAEIASFMLAREMGISHDPGPHASYVESWLKALKEDKNEIFRAARDAENIKTWVMEPARRPELEQAAGKVMTTEQQPTTPEPAKPEPAQPQAPAQQTRHYLAVPYAEKEQAKAAGAKWDKAAKSWYAPDGANVTALAKWNKGAVEKPTTLDPVEEFAQALKDRGLVLPGNPIMDGKWHRVAVDGDKGQQQSGSYMGFLDGRPAGTITNYKAGGTTKWVATGTSLSPEERAQIQAEAANIRAERQQAVRKAAEAAAKRAYGIWSNLPAAGNRNNSAYLAQKGVDGYGVKVNEQGDLVIPCRDENGKLWTIQTVSPEGKTFLTDSRKTGTFHILDKAGQGNLEALKSAPIIIAEGYATAATIHQETGWPVVAAFDSGNLKPVAEALRAKFPDHPILIAADNDHANINGNVGMTKAAEAAKSVGGSFIAPSFNGAEQDRKLTDFNDLAQSRGQGAVQNSINSALSQLMGQERGVA